MLIHTARWQSGHAAACKAANSGSIPLLASSRPPLQLRIFSGFIAERSGCTGVGQKSELLSKYLARPQPGDKNHLDFGQQSVSGIGIRRDGCGQYAMWQQAPLLAFIRVLAFIRAAHFAVRYDPMVKRFYQRKCGKILSVVAIKAVAHQLARACYSRDARANGIRCLAQDGPKTSPIFSAQIVAPREDALPSLWLRRFIDRLPSLSVDSKRPHACSALQSYGYRYSRIDHLSRSGSLSTLLPGSPL